MEQNIREIVPELDKMIERQALIVKGMQDVNKEYEAFGKAIKDSSKKLEKSIDKVSGATEQEQRQLEETAKSADKLVRAQERYREAMSENEQQIRDLRATQKALLKQRELEKKVNESAEGSYDQLSAKYSLIKLRLNQMSRAERDATEEGRRMVQNAAEIRAEMSRLQRETGNHTLEVGNYENANINLIESFQGMPGPMSDVAGGFEGIKAQLMHLLKNPYVALFASIAVAIVAVGKAFASTRRGSAVFTQQMDKVQTRWELVKKSLRDTSLTVADTMKDATEAVKKGGLKELWNDNFKSMTNTALKFGLNMITGNIFTAVGHQIADNKEEIADYVKEGEKAAKVIDSINEEIKRLTASLVDQENESMLMQANLTARVEQLQILADDDTRFMGDMRKSRLELADVELMLTQETSRLADIRLAQQELLIDKAVLLGHVSRNASGEIISLTKEGIEIERTYTEVKLEAIAASNAIKTAEMQNNVEKAKLDRDIFEQRLDLLLDIADREKSINESRLSDEKTSLAEKGQILLATQKLVEDSYTQQIALFKQDLGIQLDRNALANSNNQEIVAYAEGLKMSEIATNRLREVIMERRQAVEDLKNAEQDLADETYKAQLDSITQLAELDKLRAENAGKTQEEIERIEITAQIERYKKQLEIAKEFGQDMTDLEIAIVQEKIIQLNKKLEGEGKKQSIWAKLGFTEEEGAKVVDGIKQVYAKVTEVLKTFANQRLENAEMLVQAKNMEVSSAENALNRQIELAEMGYASNVATAQKNLLLSQQAQKAAMQQQQQALKAKQRLETVEQATSLITASANVFKSFSAIPIIGIPLAIAAIGTMFGSFVSQKVKANQVTQELGDGGYLEIEAGRHGSGKDVVVHETSKKKVKAEGGEGMAIFSRKTVRRLGKKLPRMVESIERGQMEDRYSNAFSTELMPPSYQFDNGFDSHELKEIKRVLLRMESQGDSRPIMDNQGRKIYKKGNTTRIVS